MNLYLRLIMALLRSYNSERLHYRAVTESHFRVLPHDLDAFRHMNNGRYLQIMDVARAEWMLRTGVASAIRRQRWSPILGGGVVRYRHSLRLFQKYLVRTRLLGWDKRWFYLEHSFVDQAGRCVAVGVKRAGLRTPHGWAHTGDVVNAVYPGAESPPIPAHVLEWMRLDDALYRSGAHLAPLDNLAELRKIG